MFGKLLFFFVFPKLGISYKAKKGEAHTIYGFPKPLNNYADHSAVAVIDNFLHCILQL